MSEVFWYALISIILLSISILINIMLWNVINEIQEYHIKRIKELKERQTRFRI